MIMFLLHYSSKNTSSACIYTESYYMGEDTYTGVSQEVVIDDLFSYILLSLRLIFVI